MGGWSILGAQVDRLVTTILQASVGRVAVGYEQTADCDVVADEGVQAFAVDVDDALRAASCWIFSSLDLDRPDHENLADGADVHIMSGGHSKATKLTRLGRARWIGMIQQPLPDMSVRHYLCVSAYPDWLHP